MFVCTMPWLHPGRSRHWVETTWLLAVFILCCLIARFKWVRQSKRENPVHRSAICIHLDRSGRNWHTLFDHHTLDVKEQLCCIYTNAAHSWLCPSHELQRKPCRDMDNGYWALLRNMCNNTALSLHRGCYQIDINIDVNGWLHIPILHRLESSSNSCRCCQK